MPRESKRRNSGRRRQDFSQEFVENLLEYVVFALDVENVITSWNPGVKEVFGYTAEEFIGQRGEIIFTPEDRAAGAPQQELDTAKREGRAPEERWHLRKDGGRVFVSGVMVSLHDVDGELQGFTKACDETRREQAEEALRESEERLRRALDIGSVGIVFFDGEGRFTDANDAFLELSGFGLRELTSLTWKDLTPPEWLKASREALDQLKATGHIPPYEKEYLRKDGSRFWGLFAASTLSENESVEYIIDITSRKEGEEALRHLNETLEQRVEERTEELARSEKRFRQAFEVGPVAACITTFEADRFLDVNASFLRLSGYEASALLGRTAKELDMWSGKEDQTKLEAALKGGLEFHDLELHLRTKEGLIRDILGSGEVIQLDGSQGWLKMFIDITERKRSQEQLMAAIQKVMSDTAWFSRSVVERLANVGRSEESAKEVVELTPRERQVLERMAKGMSDKQIVEELGLSHQTVRNYVTNIYSKIDVNSRAQAVVWARERGLVG